VRAIHLGRFFRDMSRVKNIIPFQGKGHLKSRYLIFKTFWIGWVNYVNSRRKSNPRYKANVDILMIVVRRGVPCPEVTLIL